MHFSLSILFAAAISYVSAQTACNGNAALCDRLYSNVSQIGDHDSAFVGVLPTQNQLLSVTDQLDSGIRFLQGQAHNLDGQLFLCHTSCLEEDSGSLVDYLTTVKEWMDVNPNEVITLLLTNGDGVAIATWGDDFVSSGISQYAFTPTGTLTIPEWPTLQTLINGGTRLVTFLDSGADVTQVPYILDEFTYFFETPFDTTDPTFAECTLDRPAGASPDGRMYIVNHFLDVDIFGIDIPDELAATTTNAATGTGSIGAQSALCESIYGRPPNFVLIDYASLGDWPAAQDALNGL